MKKSKHYAVIASHRRVTLLKYSMLGLLLTIVCALAVVSIIQGQGMEQSYLTLLAAVVFAVLGIWLFVKFFWQTIHNTLLAGDDKHLFFKKRLIPWTQIAQFLFTSENRNGKTVPYLTVAFDYIPVNASFSFSKDKQPAVGEPVMTSHPKKDTIYRIRLDDVNQPIDTIESLLYEYLDKYGKK